jgi:hypothetical protein
MTLGQILQGQPASSQLEIMSRADRTFAGDRRGRFFGGQLSEQEVEALTKGVELRAGTLERLRGAKP